MDRLTNRVREVELLNIDNIRDEKDVEEKETNEDPIQVTLRKGKCSVFHVYL
jgi:hypothetical protein